MNIPEIAANYINAAAKESGIPASVITSKRRTRVVVRVRWAVMSALRDLGLPYMEIGYALNRDHGSVIHGCEACRHLTGFDKQVFDAAKEAAKATLSNQTKP